jgi:hypothetical protein
MRCVYTDMVKYIIILFSLLEWMTWVLILYIYIYIYLYCRSVLAAVEFIYAVEG